MTSTPLVLEVPQALPGPIPAVALRGATRVFDGVPAVTAVTLTIPAGEVVLLQGHNGSGKSTLLRILATAISPTFGGGSLLGLDLHRDRTRIRAHTELLGHRARLYADLSAAENLRFTCGLYGLECAGIGYFLERVGLADVGAVRVGSFSQGMRQRLAIARCLMRSPDLVLLDEPYAGLDADARLVIDDLLADSRERGATVVLASHEPPPPDLVSSTVRLENGRLAGTTGSAS